MRIQRLTPEEFHKATFRPVEFSRDFTEDEFDRKWEQTLVALRKRLSRHWRDMDELDEGESGDFGLSDDRNNAWVQCGGIYTRRALCREFFTAVAEVIGKNSFAEQWAVHFVIELWMEEEPDSPSGEIMLRKDGIYIPTEGKIDYRSLIRTLTDGV